MNAAAIRSPGPATLDLQARLLHLSGLHPGAVVPVLADLVFRRAIA